MSTAGIKSILSRLNKNYKRLNILTCPTHERYESNLCKTGHNFYAIRSEQHQIKKWNSSYAPKPINYHLIDMSEIERIPLDLVLIQQKFGQYQLLKPIANQLMLPSIVLEHTLPHPSWPKQQLIDLKNMRGELNLFISDYSKEAWGWANDEAHIIKHGIDVDTFVNRTPIEERNNVSLSVVNDWINRDWCMLAGQKILTEEGYKNIEDIHIGDIVLSDNGIYNMVSDTFRRDYNGKLIEIELENGIKNYFTPEHAIRVFRDNQNKQWQYIAANRIKPNEILRFPNHIQTDFSITCPDFAWLIGLIIGDGYISNNGSIQISFNQKDRNKAEKAILLLNKFTNNSAYITKETNTYFQVECTSKIFGLWIKNKIYNNKFKQIPLEIMESSDVVRRACLVGLFDADGSFKNGEQCDRFCYSSNSYKLASQVSSILHSFNCKCSINKEDRITNKTNGKIKTIYRVVGYGTENVNKCNYLINTNNIINSYGYKYHVKAVNEVDYSGIVYNCKVENNPSYVVYPGFVAHNCCGFTPWNNATRGLPVTVLGDTPGLSFPAKSTEELVSAYNSSRIFVNTSTVSPIPTALMEAMACGCAVISLNNCMIPEVVKDGYNGILCDSEAELRSAIVTLMQEPKICSILGFNACKTIKDQYNLTKFTLRWNEIFNYAKELRFGT